MLQKRYQASGLLLLVAAIWGTTFVAVKLAIADMPPFTFNTIRFAIAFLSLIILYPLFRHAINKRAIGYSILAGIFVFGGYSLQTVGLQFTTASNAAFITGLSVVMVPTFITVLERNKPSWQLILGVVCAVTGLGLLTFSSPGEIQGINSGDLLVLGCAACFALYIIVLDRYTNQINTLLFATGQIATVTVLSGIIGWYAEGFPVTVTGNVIIGLLITAIPATTLATLMQTWAQKYTGPTNAAIILTLEPVFALIFAFLVLQESPSVLQLTGAALMLTGMVIAELGGPAKS